MNVHFTDVAWEDYQHWLRHDDAILRKLNDLIEDARRRPFIGLGKPEPLKGDLAGWLSRRITGDHRLVYRVAGKRGADQRIEVASCRFHYERN
ncbi:MAG TPA: Txe/YoeB family addiction module toxin [Acetobacteraceae bacterium]|nr:Txe/YoeB family addiction module toxin [Acetobacteraceae bacterium]